MQGLESSDGAKDFQRCAEEAVLVRLPGDTYFVRVHFCETLASFFSQSRSGQEAIDLWVT